MPASSALSSRLARSRDPERDLKEAHDRGEYEEYTDRPAEVMRNGRPRRRTYGLSTAQRFASYRRNGSGVHTSKLAPAPDQFKDQRNPDGSLRPDPDMVTTSSGGEITKTQAGDNARTKRKSARRLARRDIGSPAMESRPASQSIGSSMDGSALDDMPKAKAKPRLTRPEPTFEGKSKAEFFGDAANRQKRGNAFARYVAPPKQETPVASPPPPTKMVGEIKPQTHASPPKPATPPTKTVLKKPGFWDENTAKAAVAQDKKEEEQEKQKQKDARAGERDARLRRPNSRYY